MAMMLFILSAPWRASSDAKGSEKPAEFMAAILACAAPMGVTPAARHSSRPQSRGLGRSSVPSGTSTTTAGALRQA